MLNIYVNFGSLIRLRSMLLSQKKREDIKQGDQIKSM